MMTRLLHRIRAKVSSVFSFIKRQRVGLLRLLIGVILIGSYSLASATATAGIAVSTIAGKLENTLKYYSIILGDVALVAGIGFVLAALFKFHQHKQNPTQVPISQGVTLLIVGAALLIFPYILTTAKRAVFGATASVATLSGGAIGNIVGGSVTSTASSSSSSGTGSGTSS